MVRLFECFLCHKQFISKKWNLLRHMKFHGPAPTRYKCPICKRPFTNKQNYQRHWKNKHTDISVESETPKIVSRNPKRIYKCVLIASNIFECTRILDFMIDFLQAPSQFHQFWNNHIRVHAKFILILSLQRPFSAKIQTLNSTHFANW